MTHDSQSQGVFLQRLYLVRVPVEMLHFLILQETYQNYSHILLGLEK